MPLHSVTCLGKGLFDQLMTRLGWTASLLMTLGLALGVALGWGLCRAVPGGAGRIIQVARVPPYEPVEIVPESVDWPEGEPVIVATVEPPTRKERKRIRSDFGLNPNLEAILGKFELPQLPDGGSAVVSVPKPDGEDPEPVKLTVKANKPPLLRIRWEPEVTAWYGFASGTEFAGDSASWATYFSLPRLACIREKVCLQARAGREERPWGGGWVAELGVGVRF